ncbi:DUF4105 domain-containing protein [Ramlibacter sp. PS3R-8]|uniref:Lnb N-terminal periplasmic domain-containing protein n=1 Tax=Ramlibacter sp. PS3R-8 TaxID=3133437 RepID=UPI0030A98D61
MSVTRKSFVRKTGRAACVGITAAAILCAGAWGAGLLHFAGPGGPATRQAMAITAGVVALASCWMFFVPGRRRHGLLVAGALFVALLGWWSGIRPSNDREWAPEVARLAHATVDGDVVTVHNIRNFDYRSETVFDARYYDRSFDLRKLESVDLVSVYWMGPAIAHLFVTFGFGDAYLAVSIEARRERTEGYSTLGGFFRQYELVYVVGDERDLIRLRTNYRKDPPEDVYLLRLQAPVENARRFFLDYVAAINALRDAPEFYNTLLTNCTTRILLHARANPDAPVYSWKALASGYAPEYAYDEGRLDTSLPFSDLMRASHVNEAARAADTAPDFSRRIRHGLPGMAAR